MGRDCGYLALVSALTSGAEVCIIPEISYDLPSLKKKLLKQIKEGRAYLLCIVSEGAKATEKIAKWIEEDIGCADKSYNLRTYSKRWKSNRSR